MRWLVACAVSLTLLAWGTRARALDPSIQPTQYVHQMWTELNGLPQNAALALGQSSDGFVWVATEEGLARFDGRRFEVWDRSAHPALDSSAVRALHITSDNTVWFGTYDGVVCALRHQVVELCYGLDSGLPREFVRAIQIDSEGTLWVATSAGLFMLRGQRFVRSLDGRVMALAQRNNELLAGTDHGVFVWRNNRFEPFAFESQMVLSLHVGRSNRTFVGITQGVFELGDGEPRAVSTDLTVRSIGVDADDNVWLGASTGIFRCRDGVCLGTNRPQVVYAVLIDSDGHVWYGNAFEGLHKLANPTVLSIGAAEGFDIGPTGGASVAADGTVWIATHGHGVIEARFEGTILHKVREWRVTDGLPTDDVDGVEIDHEGIVWAATTRGFAAIDHGVLFVPPPADQAPGVSWQLVARRASDSHVFGWALGRGFLSMHGHELRWFPEVQGLGDASVRGIFPANDGSLWVGSATEMLRVDMSGATPHVVARFPVPGALSFEDDSELGLLFGTISRGLAMRRADGFHVHGRESGLPSDLLFSLAIDNERALWGAFNGGLVHISRASLRVMKEHDAVDVPVDRIGVLEGLRAGECNGGRPGRLPNGWLLFPTVEGMAMVRGAIAQQPHPHPLLVDAVHIDDARIAFGARPTIPPGDHQLRVRFTAPFFEHADQIAIRTRLRGVESAWRDVGESREVRFSRLPPGDYTIDAEAWFRGANIGSTSLSMGFTVLPHWTQTWWFRSLCALALGLMVLAVFGLRTRALRQRALELAQTVKERTAQLEERTRSLDQALTELKSAQAEVIRAEREASIATLVQGVAHELNNPINFLSANVAPLRNYSTHLARVAKELSDGRTRTPDELESLTRFSPKKNFSFVLEDLDAVLRDVDEGARRAKIIVADLQNLKSSTSRSLVTVDLNKAVAQTLRLAAPRMHAQHKVEVHTEEGLLVTARAGHVEQVLANLIDNALRAMPEGGELMVRAWRKDGEIVLSVGDSGVGMDEETLRRCREPFFTTRPAGSGTGLGLSLVASMVAAADATLHIESTLGKGTTVLVHFPDPNAQK